MRRTILWLAGGLFCVGTMAGQQAPSQPATAPQPPAPQAQPEQRTAAQIADMEAKLQDWPDLARYRDEDAQLPPPAPGENRVVFLGDSITDAWGRTHGKFFPGNPWVNRGISGQTTPQMLVRFQQDVLALHPAAVVILAGTNDIAENTGPESMSAIEDNFRSMVTLAKANHVRVVLSSVLPASRFNWRPSIQPVEKIRELNQWLQSYAAEQHLVYLNYYPALVNAEGGMKPELTTDGTVHPNDAGYDIMEPLAEQAVAKALSQPAP
ncbi:MAG: SGNH/GDSL hydrolase family protein [Acidobacteriaceae bacterium]